MFKVRVVTPLTKNKDKKLKGKFWGGVRANKTLRVRVYFPTTTHMVKREYLLYTFDSFVADVGGYLGLLLGHRQD